jgi:hypothetical protein
VRRSRLSGNRLKMAPAEEDSRSEWEIAGYQEALADIRWAKERMGEIVQWAVILLGALTAVARTVSAFGSCSFVTFGVLVSGCAIWWLIDLHLFARKTRDRVDSLLERAPAVMRPKRPRDRNHVKYLAIQSIVIVIACAVAVVAILTAPAGDSPGTDSQPNKPLQPTSGG